MGKKQRKAKLYVYKNLVNRHLEIPIPATDTSPEMILITSDQQSFLGETSTDQREELRYFVQERDMDLVDAFPIGRYKLVENRKAIANLYEVEFATNNLVESCLLKISKHVKHGFEATDKYEECWTYKLAGLFEDFIERKYSKYSKWEDSLEGIPDDYFGEIRRAYDGVPSTDTIKKGEESLATTRPDGGRIDSAFPATFSSSDDKNTYSDAEDFASKKSHNSSTGIMEPKKADSRQQVQLLLGVFKQATQEVREEFVNRLPEPERQSIKEAVIAAEERGYRELIFGNETPSVALFNAWLKKLKGSTLPKDQKKGYATAINFCKTSMKLKLMHKSKKTNEKWVVCGFEAVEKSQYTVGFRVYLTSDKKSSIYSRTAFPLLKVAR